MKAAIYCRVSTDNQEREGTSLQTQLENCVTYCQSKGYDISHRLSKAYSGLSLERPELDKLRELVRNDDIKVYARGIDDVEIKGVIPLELALPTIAQTWA